MFSDDIVNTSKFQYIHTIGKVLKGENSLHLLKLVVVEKKSMILYPGTCKTKKILTVQ